MATTPSKKQRDEFSKYKYYEIYSLNELLVQQTGWAELAEESN